MKRLLVLFAVLVPLSLLIVGCGQGGGSSKGSAVDTKEKMEKMTNAMKAMAPADGPKGIPGGPGAPGRGGQK